MSGQPPEYAAAAEEMGAELVRRGIGLVLARASAADLVQALEDWRPVRVEKMAGSREVARGCQISACPAILRRREAAIKSAIRVVRQG
jgi:hypothetical protein